MGERPNIGMARARLEATGLSAEDTRTQDIQRAQIRIRDLVSTLENNNIPFPRTKGITTNFVGKKIIEELPFFVVAKARHAEVYVLTDEAELYEVSFGMVDREIPCPNFIGKPKPSEPKAYWILEEEIRKKINAHVESFAATHAQANLIF